MNINTNQTNNSNEIDFPAGYKKIEEENPFFNIRKSNRIIPRDYQIKIFENILYSNSIVFLETGKGKTFISIMLIKELLGLDKFKDYKVRNKKPVGKKVIFLVCEVAIVDQQSMVISQNTPLLVKACSGKNMKSMRKNIETFRSTWAQFDVFVATPMVIYQLLSIGYLNITDIELLVFDECHHTDSNHPYNLIMNEFYFFYKSQGFEIKLPKILGLTASPLKTKIDNDILSTASKALCQICENLDSNIVIDPEIKSYNLEIESSDGIFNLSNQEATREYIEVIPHLEVEQFKVLIANLNKHLLYPLIEYCFDNINQSDVKCFKDEYITYVDKKFECMDIIQYNRLLSSYKYLYELRKTSGLFSFFEKFQIHLFMIIENINFDCIINLIEGYINNLANLLVNGFDTNSEYETTDLNTKNVKRLIKILDDGLTNCKLFQKNFSFDYYSDRLYNLQIKIENILSEDLLLKVNEEHHRIIIFVSNRIVAEYLTKIVNKFIERFSNKQNQFRAVHVVGVNKRKSEVAVNPKNSATLLNENIEKFKNGYAQILIATNTVEEGLDVKACDVVIVYTELRTAKSYIQMKGRARKVGAKFLVFTPDKSKTIQAIEQFVNLTICMRNLFDDDIVKDFKRFDFLELKKIQYLMYFNKKNHAKITLKNASVIFNEFLQILKSNKNCKKLESKINFIEKREYRGLGMTTVFIGQLVFLCEYVKFIFPNQINNIISDSYLDKASAESHCYVVFLEICHKNNIVDNNFKILLK